MLSPDAGAGESGYEAAEESGEPAQCPGRAGGVLLGCPEPSGAYPVARRCAAGGAALGQGMVGRLTGDTDKDFERRFSYDGLGRVTQERVSRDGASLSVGYGYDEAAGELNTITYPSSRVPSWQP